MEIETIEIDKELSEYLAWLEKFRKETDKIMFESLRIPSKYFTHQKNQSIKVR